MVKKESKKEEYCMNCGKIKIDGKCVNRKCWLSCESHGGHDFGFSFTYLTQRACRRCGIPEVG